MRQIPLQLLALAMLAGCLPGFGAEVPTAVAERGEFRTVLTIAGELEAVRSTTIAAPPLRGQAKVTSIVEEGTRVEKGDLVVEFDRSDLEKSLEEALDLLEVARTKITQKTAQQQVHLADLDNEVTRAQLNLQRARMRVTDSETIPLVDRESARLDVQEYGLSVERSRAALESARLQGNAELQLLQLEVRQRESAVERVREEISQTRIHAPADGLVILPEVWKGGGRGSIKVGDTLWRGTTIMELPDMSTMQVEAWVHEVDAGKVRKGQRVDVVIDAFPDPPHAGVVARVADLAVKRRDGDTVKHLKVQIELERTTEVMKPGMTVRAEVEVGNTADVVSLPQEAVFHEGDQTFVYERGLTGWSRVPVVVGEANDTHIVVTDGLTAGTEVALVDPADAAPSTGDPSEGS